MKIGIEIKAPGGTHERRGWLVYDETGVNLEGFTDANGRGDYELARMYGDGDLKTARERVRIVSCLEVTGKEWKRARENRILNPGDKLT